MKSVYIESSIPSYLAARPSREVRTAAWQELTVQWWEQARQHYELYTSEIVVEEVAEGDTAAAERHRNSFPRRATMYEDEILTEVWKNRDAVAKRHHHNLHEIVIALQKRQQNPLTVVVDKRHRAKGAMECRETRQS